jgi:hypothetical protein
MVFNRFFCFLSSINNEFMINNLNQSNYNYNFYVDSDLIDDTSYIYSILFKK